MSWLLGVCLFASSYAAVSAEATSTGGLQSRPVADPSLKPPKLDRLPVGAILPDGWLLRQAELMSTGLTGVLPFWHNILAAPYYQSIWIAGTGPFNRDEQEGEYYMNGMIPLSCQIDAPKLRELREASITKILAGVDKHGMLGLPVTPGKTVGKQNYWNSMIIVLALESYCECTGPYAPAMAKQAKVEAALIAHYKATHTQVAAQNPPFWTGAWGSARYVEVLIGVQWLIDRGHNDAELWDLMRIVQGGSENVLQWEARFINGDPSAHIDLRCWGNRSDPAMRNFMRHHGVNIMEAIKTGPVWWRVTGNGTDLNNSAAAVRWIDKWARSADGTFTAPDCIMSAPHAPTTGAETCATVEEMYSLRTAYEITGDVELFDRLEWVAFNAYPMTTFPDFSGNAYYHMVNQISCEGKYGFGINSCCTGNVHQGCESAELGPSYVRRRSVACTKC